MDVEQRTRGGNVGAGNRESAKNCITSTSEVAARGYAGTKASQTYTV